LGIDSASHRIEGRSLLPITRADNVTDWREATFSELDYGFRRARVVLGRDVRECRAFMVRTAEWKFVHWQGFRPQLFDLQSDPGELIDLGADPRLGNERARLRDHLFDWLTTLKRRTTVADAEVRQRTDAHRQHGIEIGVW
jgi:arylsulfatase A-like enzyme